MQLRARLFQRIVSRVIIDDEGEGPITLTIEGHLVPESAPLEAANPVLACADLLDAYETTKRGKTPLTDARAAREAEERRYFETVADEAYSETVSKFYDKIMAMRKIRAGETRTLRYTGWSRRSAHSRVRGVPSWRSAVTTE